jgi:bifunctional non-homologous end joining protein LigD
MGLQSYQDKRKFTETPEPKGKVQRHPGPLRFGVQKHQARSLHFDLRLEAGGTLKSWAVPKGPPLTHEDKRLAIMVEDHPLDYLLFEGNIPKGNYGAGSVMVWDTGSYHVPGVADPEKSEQLILEGLDKGRLHVVFHGKKLKGEYALVRTKGQQENGWLFFNKGKPRIPQENEDRSVITDRTMDEIARGAPTRQPKSGIDLSDAPKGAMPHAVRPMLATPVDEPFDRPGWVFEVKWDGYRAIAEVQQGKVCLYSRNMLSFEKRFFPIVDSLQLLGHDAVIDGEMVALDRSGKPKFQLIQDYPKSGGLLVYMVFDLLYLDGHKLEKLPLTRRKEILAGIIEGLPGINLSEHIPERGVAFFRAVEEQGLEGILAKDGTSSYRQGIRSHSWLKIKTHLRQEAVIGGFTEPKGARSGLGSLLLGVYDNGDLIHIGHVGTGFNQKTLAEVRSRLDPLIQDNCPFQKKPKPNAPVHWVRPQLVCEISFDAWTNDSIVRHPVFLGLREDKDAKEVRREQPVQTEENAEMKRGEEPEKGRRRDTEKRRIEDGESKIEDRESTRVNPRSSILHPQGSSLSSSPPPGMEEIDGHLVSVTNLNKIYWPEDGYTKGDLIGYYREIADFILPYLRDRPESLNRHPNGIHAKNFFQKDVSRQPPPNWVQTVELISDSDGKKMRTPLCQDEASLVYLANLGCIELNPWHSRVDNLDRPDYLMLDLDPEAVSFDHVVEAALTIRKVLEQAGGEAFCKTSGKRGLHLYVPLGAKYDDEIAKQVAELIARIVNARLPATTSLIRNPRLRQGRVYLDYLQNGKGKTLAAPYSVRPWPKATVSAPLKWKEVRRGLDPSKFTIRTLPKRLHAVSDLWKGVLGPGVDLSDVVEKLGSMLKKPG